jgi:hypothetical protein
MADNFVDAVKEMHAKLERMKAPVASQQQKPATPMSAVNLIKKFPQLVYPKTGK